MHLSSPVDDGELWYMGTREGKGCRVTKNEEALCIVKYAATGGRQMNIAKLMTTVSTIIAVVLRIKYIRQMDNNRSGHSRLGETSKELNVL